MEYTEFIDFIKIRAIKEAPEGARVCVNKVIKTNDTVLDGLTILERGRYVSPTVYLNPYYERYKRGAELETLFQEIYLVYETYKDSFEFPVSLFENFENLKEHITFRLVNTNRNKQLLEEAPHRDFLDLSIIYYCLIDAGDGNMSAALIRNDNLKGWCNAGRTVTEEELFSLACENTPRLLPPIIRSVRDLFLHGFDDDKDDFEDQADQDDDEDALFERLDYNPDWAGEARISREQIINNNMYIITNCYRRNGAAVLLYDGLLEKFAECTGRNFYILPSSIHEIILLPDEPDFDLEGMSEMVSSVNRNGVAPEEVLSDHAYYYHADTGEIEF